MATDLTFNIAALDKASQTFIKLAGQVDRMGDRLDALDRKKANPKVDLDTSSFDRKIATSEKGIDAFSQRGQTQLLALAGVLGTGALTGGALVAIPAAIAAIGVAAEKSNPVVKQSFDELTQSAKQTAVEGFLPLTPALTNFAAQAKTSLGQIKPELQEGAEAAAPLLSILGTDFLKATQQGIGASIPIIQSARPIAQALGQDLIKTEQGAAGLFRNLDTKEAAQGISVIGDDIELLLPELGQLASEIIPLGNSLLTVAGPAFKSTADAAEALAPVITSVATAVSFLTPDFAAYAPVVATVITATKLLTGSWTDFGGAVSRIKPLFTDFGGTLETIGQKLGYTTAATNEARSAEAAEVAVKAELAKASADAAVAEAEQALAADTSEKNAVALIAAQKAQAIAAEQAAAAEEALDATTTEATFSFGPLGIALGAIAFLALPFVAGMNSSSDATSKLTGELTNLEQAASGVQSLAHLFQTDPNAQAQLELLQKYGVTIKDLTAAQNGNVAAQQKIADAAKQASDAINSKTASDQHQLDILTAQNTQTNAQGVAVTTYTRALRQAQQAVDADHAAQAQANQTYKDAKNQLDSTTAAQSAAAQATAQSSAVQQQAAGIAKVLGISIGEATQAYAALASGQTFAMSATQQASDTILGQVLAVGKANSTVSDYFKQADQQLSQAQTAVSDASHSYQESISAVADAQHSYQQSVQAVADAQHSFAQSEQAVTTAQQGVVTAQRAVTDALNGVTTAEQNVTKARQASRQAQIGLTQAEAAATEQLKELHLQLADQVTSEESARVSLFDAQQAGAKLGVNAANAQSIANQVVSASNEDRVKAAIALLQAENSLNDTLNTGTNLRKQVSDADKAGVAGSAQVIQAEQQIANAQQQVVSSEQALIKAKQAVSDARAGVAKAEQGVTDALYNEQKARQGVQEAEYNEAKARDAITTAEYNETKALQSVKAAQDQLNTARDNASHSMDINTAAGQRNFGMLKQVADQLFANEAPTKAANDLINDTATAFGISNKKARDLLTSLGLLTKKPFKFSVQALGSVDLSRLPQLPGLGKGAHFSFAGGGQVFGPGGPRDDMIPAMLSNREFVQPTSSVEYYGVPFMEAIRQKRLPKFFADGGLAVENLAWSQIGIEYQDAAQVMRLMHAPGALALLPAYVPPAIDFGAIAAGSGLRGSRAANEKIVQQVWASMFGWTGAEWAATIPLIMQESGFNNVAQNPTSTAFGMFQFLNSTWAGYGIPKTSDPTLQSIAGGRYIKSRYGDPIAALAHERVFNWYSGGGLAVKPPKTYDSGGWLGAGEVGRNRGGRPEAVLTPEESQAFVALAKSIHSSSGGGKSPIEVHVHASPGADVDHIVTEVMRRLQFHGR